MRIDKLVDGTLIDGVDLLELQSHAVSAIAPGHAAFRIDVALGARQPEAQPHLRTAFERAGGADGDAAAAEVQGERRGDGVAEAIRDGNAEHDARAGAPVEVV